MAPTMIHTTVSLCVVSVSIVVGVPTIKRDKESYLTQTLTSLIDSLNDDEREECLIVVFVGEVRSDYVVYHRRV